MLYIIFESSASGHASTVLIITCLLMLYISVNTVECAVPVNLTIEWYLRSSPCYNEVFGFNVSVYLPKKCYF